MTNYIYTMKDSDGRILRGFLRAQDKKDLRRRLKNTNLFFVSAQVFPEDQVSKLVLNLDMLLIFTRRLSSLIDAGIPILSATNIMWRQSEDREIQLVVSHIHNKLEEGQKISEAMKDFPRIFPPIYQSMIAVAEKAGGLPHILKKLVEYLEYQKNFITKIKKATMYPLIVVIFALAVVFFMFTFVVPTFQKVLDQLDVELPIITKIVIMISELLRNPFFIGVVVIAVVGACFLYKTFKKNKTIALWMDSLVLRTPYLGKVLHTMALSRFMHSLATLLGAGLPILESFDVAKSIATNEKVVSSIDKVKSKIEQGMSLHDSFKGIDMFPVILIEMIGVAEASGSMVKILNNLANQFDEETDYIQNKFFTIIEPALIVVVGGIILVTLLAIYLPIVSIWQGLMAK